MKEEEVEALMAGQEDSNGCINYEGTTNMHCWLHQLLTNWIDVRPCLTLNSSLLIDILFLINCTSLKKYPGKIWIH
jgi:hypothetical protein